MGQWYRIENGYYTSDMVYTFDRNEFKRNNTIYIQHGISLLYFTYWSEESKIKHGLMMEKLPYTDFRHGIIYIMFSNFEKKEELLYEIEEGDLVSYMEIV